MNDINTGLHKMAKKLKGISITDIRKGRTTGAFCYNPLNVSEYTIHEIAHYITLNKNLKYLYSDFDSNDIEEELDSCGRSKADTLEIHTAAITLMTGVELKLWTYNETSLIMDSCKRNLSYKGSF